jgi:hypothetical protein
VSAREGAARADAETGEVMENQRAYALFQVKALDSKRRTFSGVATTPSLDRVGDIDYDEIEIYELSMVSIPALPDAVISAVKCMDGRPLPRDVIRSIRLADARERTVKLVQVRSNVGAVRLTK